MLNATRGLLHQSRYVKNSQQAVEAISEQLRNYRNYCYAYW
jgi:hypothetical protein